MDLDVLVPFHRVDNFFREAISSLGECRGVNFRTILIDDRKDRSQGIMELLQNLKFFEIVKTNGGEGYGAALKVGTSATTADAVALFNSDDLVRPDRFKIQLKALETHELSVSNIGRIDAKGNQTTSLAGRIFTTEYDPIFLLFGAYGANATWCMRKDWWTSNAFFDSKECLDWRIALKAFPNSQICYSPEPLYLYRKHSSQVTSNKLVESNLMDVVYTAWNQFNFSAGMPLASRSIFDFVATPWLHGSLLDLVELDNWSHQLNSILSFKTAEIRKNLKYLLNRRQLFALRQELPVFTKLKLAFRGSPAAIGLLKDFLD
jgi:glycosyltransferase involved in cell wall biosynthesis